MISPKNIKKHLGIYCAIGLMTLTTLSLGELTRPSYALLTSKSQTSMTFSAAASFPQKEGIKPQTELTTSQTSEKPINGAVKEQEIDHKKIDAQSKDSGSFISNTTGSAINATKLQ